MPGITNGAELVKKLKESGTPDHLLTAARKCLHETHAATGKAAPAADVVDALAAALNPGGKDHRGTPYPEHGTVAKARQLAETGKVAGPSEPTGEAIEDVLLAPKAAK